jgi:hypothetical protein
MRIFPTSLLLALVLVGTAGGTQPELPPESGLLAGQVGFETQVDSPRRSAIVSIFNVAGGPPPDDITIRRVPDGLVRVGASGLFRINLPPGRYYLGVLFRRDLEMKGPPTPDEKYFFPRDERGALRQFEVVAGKTSEIGSLSGTEPESTPEIADALVIEGTIADERGKPVAGALIMVRNDLVNPRPLFISKRTKADGRYQLKLPAGGPYYLVVRERLVDVGRPRPGDFVGTYGGSPPRAAGQAPSIFSGGKPVGGTANQVLKDIDITMYKIPDPEETKKRILQESESPIVPGGKGPAQPDAK